MVGFFLELHFTIFEGAGDFLLLAHADEYRNLVGRHLLSNVLRQRCPVELFQRDRWRNGCHARTTIGVRDLNTVYNGVLDAVQFHQDGFNFCGGDVLAFPAEGITQAVGEGYVLVTLVIHQVTCVKPAVVLLENVAQQFAVGGVFVGVAFKRLLVVHLGDQQAAVARLHRNHKAFVVTQWCVFFDVVLNDVVRKRAETRGFIEVKGVGEYQITLGCTVELIDVINVETVFKLHPDVRAQTVTYTNTDVVLGIRRLGRRIQQVAAQLADVAEARRVVVTDVVPET